MYLARSLLMILYHPPRLAPLRTGGPFGVLPVLDLRELVLDFLASGCSAVCFLARASFNTSVNGLVVSFMLIFTCYKRAKNNYNRSADTMQAIIASIG